MSDMSLNIWNEKFIKAFVDGDFVIDCKEIKLTQNTKKDPLIWIGSGSLVVHPHEGIDVRFISLELANPMDALVKATSVNSGELIPDDHYFSLVAIDMNGDTWTNPSVDVKTDAYQSGTVVKFKCNWIKQLPIPTKNIDSIHMLFMEKLRIPLNALESTLTKRLGRENSSMAFVASSGQAGGAEIEYWNSTDELQYSEIFAKSISEVKLPPSFEHRLIESLRFMMAKNVAWALCETNANGFKSIEISSSRISKTGLFPPPLYDRRDLTEDFYKLLDCYLKYAILQNSDDVFSSISLKMGSLYQLNDVSLESIALLVSVAVEGLLKEEFNSLGVATASTKLDVGVIKACIKSLAIKAATLTRVESLLGNLLSSSAADKLYELKQAGVITEDEIKMWKSLRNTSAHGGLHLAPEKFQEVLNKIYTSAQLLNKLVFIVIKYNGKYVDYSKSGWPVADFRVATK